MKMINFTPDEISNIETFTGLKISEMKLKDIKAVAKLLDIRSVIDRLDDLGETGAKITKRLMKQNDRLVRKLNKHGVLNDGGVTNHRRTKRRKELVNEMNAAIDGVSHT